MRDLRDALRAGGRAHVFVAILIAAFVLQIGITRSHFHFGSALSSAAIAGDLSAGVQKAGDQKQRPAHNETDCPIWHAAGICGGAVVAVAHELRVPTSIQTRAPLDARVIFPERFAASWRSRGPPVL